ncbi:AraC family transcriptional regulator [Kutzneria sp. CA-103260]|uniref:AraC family transcriptional regulator n=1 Tax=Kutzneria sp. CA-103260 TaxID=2802641 RepID=UPI001BA470D2|nr:helix-turn-helix domain-containing protein [Kutzneria sp. CA-103260]QUQ63493.1 AraC family transcriptional regulator [Kutzneria sp. CA-103260]
MVRSGQDRPLVEFGFSNPDRPRLGVELVDYSLLSSRLPPETLAAVHRTDFHQLFLFRAGEASTMVDFADLHCPAGTLLSVCPGRVLRLPRAVTADVDAVAVLFTVSFPPRLERVRTLLSPFGPVTWSVPAEEWGGIDRAVSELQVEYSRAAAENSTVSTDLVRQLLGALLLRVARLPVAIDHADDGHRSDETFQSFRRELEKDFATTRNAAVYAGRIGYSLRSLNRACQAATGRSAKALIDARVALEAKRMLAHTTLSAAAVGHRLGFSEATNFTKFFVRETGLTPGAFRADEL